MYIRPTFLPEAALLPEATFPLRPAQLDPQLPLTNVRAYEPANSSQNAAYSQHLTTTTVRTLIPATPTPTS
jgi:hypothetical protein